MGRKWIVTTDWSLVARAADVNVDVKRHALTELLNRYLSALKFHLTCHRHLSAEEAEDVIQGFLVSKVLEQDLIGRAQREKGRFRNFLLTALDRYAYDWLRGQRKFNKSRGEKEEPEPSAAGPSPSSHFDIAWARQVLAETLRRMREECDGYSQTRIWKVFEKRLLSPLLDQSPIPAYEELVKELGFESPSQASNALITAKRMFQRNLRSVVAEYEPNTDDIESEIMDLHHILSLQGA
jgi:DNA-directed RNA polymerase specialized sigma24 family protein